MVYVISGDENWLEKAREMTDYALAHFYAKEELTFFYTNQLEEKLIVRKAEWSDNVIPASSSQMAINLKKLSVYFDEHKYRDIATALLNACLLYTSRTT